MTPKSEASRGAAEPQRRAMLRLSRTIDYAELSDEETPAAADAIFLEYDLAEQSE